jgi:hypothetical protein
MQVTCTYRNIPLRISSAGVTYNKEPVRNVKELIDHLRPYGEVAWRPGSLPKGHAGLVISEKGIKFNNEPIDSLETLKQRLDGLNMVVWNGWLRSNESSSLRVARVIDEANDADANAKSRHARALIESFRRNQPGREVYAQAD